MNNGKEYFLEDKNSSFEIDIKYAETIITLYKLFVSGEIDSYFNIEMNFENQKVYRNKDSNEACFNLYKSNQYSDYDCTNNYHYICYSKDTSVSVTASGLGSNDYMIEYKDIMQMSSEMYFQLSTVRPMWQLRLMVLYWKLNLSDCDQFYMDFSKFNDKILKTILEDKGMDYVL